MSDINPDLRERLVKIETILHTIDTRLDDLAGSVSKINQIEVEVHEKIASLRAELTELKAESRAEHSKLTLMIRVIVGVFLLGSGGLSALNFLP